MKPKVSIIVPIYNVEPYLEQCVDSIRCQTVREIEIILIDDGSLDGCPEMCDRVAGEDERIRVVHQKNAGVSAARNRGIDAASADWIMFVDPDDWLELNAVEMLYGRAAENDCDIISASCYRNYLNQQVVIRLKEGEAGTYEIKRNLKFLFDRSIRRIPGVFSLRSPCGRLYRTETIRNSQCRFPIGLKYREDVVFNLYANFYAEKICILSEPIYHYRQRSESATHVLHDDELERHRRYRMEIHQFMERFQLMEEYRSYYYDAVVDGVISVGRLYGADVSSWKTMHEAVLILKKFSEEPECARAIKAIKLSSVPQKKRKLVLWLLKRHIYWAVILVAYLYRMEQSIQKTLYRC